MILLISPSWVARITDVSHWFLAIVVLLKCITCLASQVHSQRGILPWMYHTCFTHLI
jgi:hypothetical protein